MEFTPALWMILGLTLVLGWVLGLMSRSGGRRWKRELERERKEHQAAIRNRDAQIEAAKARMAELERSRSATAFRSDADAHDGRADLRQRDGAIDNLDLTHRDEQQGRTVIRPARP